MSTVRREQLAAVTFALTLGLGVLAVVTSPITAYLLGRWMA